MSAVHFIDNLNKVIVTKWEEEPTTKELIDAFRRYQREIKSKPEFIDYDEILDLSEIEGSKVGTVGLRTLADIAENSDIPSVNNKLAIVVKSILTFGLARMYETYRNLNPKRNKTIRVFKDKSGAFTWLEINNSRPSKII